MQGGAAAQLLGQGTAEALQGTLGAGGERIAEGFRGAAEDHQVCAGLEVFHQRLEKFAQLLELVGLQEVAGVEHHGLEPGAVAGNPGGGEGRIGAVAVDALGQPRGDGADLLGQRAAADQQRPLDRTHAAGLPALQTHRRRQAKGPDQAVADGRVGEVDVAI